MFFPCPLLFFLPFCSISLFLFGFFTVSLRFSALFSLFSHTFHLLRYLPPLVLDFSAFGFLFFGFLSAFSLFCCRFCPPQSRIQPKNLLFCPFLRFLFPFLCLHDRLLHRFFCFFPVFFLRLSALAEEKSKIRRFHLSNSKKSCEQCKRRRRKAKTGGAGREKRRQKGKIGTHSRHHLTKKQAFFSLTT